MSAQLNPPPTGSKRSVQPSKSASTYAGSSRRTWKLPPLTLLGRASTLTRAPSLHFEKALQVDSLRVSTSRYVRALLFVVNLRTLVMCALACSIIYLCESNVLRLR